MRHLIKSKMPRMMLIVSCLSLSFLSGCRGKLPPFDICITLEQPGFFCAQQGVPSKEKGYDKPYSPNMVCMEANQFNRIIDEISKRDSDIARYKYKK